jgi:dTMP kinase
MTRTGRLITIEGIDGTGKTTLAEHLRGALAARGVAVELMREPGGVTVSERIRALVTDAELTIAPRTEALLYAAARAQLVEEAIRPALASGTWVLLDRFLDSSLAYQGGGRRLGVEQIRNLNLFATAGLEADRTLLLALDAAHARTRQVSRSEEADRLEREQDEFFRLVADTYIALATADPDRIRVLDASQPREQVLADALDALGDLL